jgi:hypothetical protein
MKIYEVTDPLFHEYGRVIHGYDLRELMKAMAETPCPEGTTCYEPSDGNLECLSIAEDLSEGVYGCIPVQIGYCNGHNTKLNALEYHRSSEINIPTDGDVILLLAKRSDLDEKFRMNTDMVKAFRIPKGTMVEIYATTLHYAPCGKDMNEGFRVVVVLPKGTNLELPVHPADVSGEEKLLTAVNKWLIGHPEGGCVDGTYLGLSGKNLDVTE